MPNELAARLRNLIAAELPALHSLTEEQALRKPAGPTAWSPKQELGHLIDSAANNHLRFVRAAIAPETNGTPLHFDSYAQDAWVYIHAYQDTPFSATIAFWSQYNTFIAALIERIPPASLAVNCIVGLSAEATLGFLIDDYIVHMQHHLDHLLQRPHITPYPQTAPKPA